MPVDASPRSDDPRAEFVVPALRYRPEVDGLRAIAVIFVILFHAGFPLAPGGFIGVDVFFVISGFLITSLLAQELQETGTIRLVGFWARRARRILPAAILVLFASLAFAAPVLGPLQRVAALRDFAAAAVYILNWSLARRATDYFDIETDPSLFLHYWSLSIEEQFYVVWPLLILAAIFFAAKSGRQPRLAALCIAITAASLIFCIYLTSRNQPLAFFSTFSRAWELSLGATVALVRLPQLSARVRQGLCAAGFLAILVAGFTFIEFDDLPRRCGPSPDRGHRAHPRGRTRRSHRRTARQGAGLDGPRLSRQAVLLLVPLALAGHPDWRRGFRIESGHRHRVRHRLFAASCGDLSLRRAAYALCALLHAQRGCFRGGGRDGIARSGRFCVARAADIRPAGHPAEQRSEAGLPTSSEPTGRALVEPKCLLRHRDTDPAPCIYGDPKGTKRIVLFGDFARGRVVPSSGQGRRRCGLAASRAHQGCLPFHRYSGPELGARGPRLPRMRRMAGEHPQGAGLVEAKHRGSGQLHIARGDGPTTANCSNRRTRRKP